MNGVDFPHERVLEGIDAAAAAGLGPVKINAVVKRGVNDEGLVDMARHFRGTGHIVRFIEYMDVGATNGWKLDEVVPAREMIERWRRSRDWNQLRLRTRARSPSAGAGPTAAAKLA